MSKHHHILIITCIWPLALCGQDGMGVQDMMMMMMMINIIIITGAVLGIVQSLNGRPSRGQLKHRHVP